MSAARRAVLPVRPHAAAVFCQSGRIVSITLMGHGKSTSQTGSHQVRWHGSPTCWNIQWRTLPLSAYIVNVCHLVFKMISTTRVLKIQARVKRHDGYNSENRDAIFTYFIAFYLRIYRYSIFTVTERRNFQWRKEHNIIKTTTIPTLFKPLSPTIWKVSWK